MVDRRTWSTLGALTVLIALPLAFMLAPGAAHAGTNHGTIKVHDEETAGPETRNEPHVDCDFWIQGFSMSDSSGHLVFYSWPPTGNKEVVHTVDWTADSEEEQGAGGFNFLDGPFTFEAGHYRVEAYTDEGHPGSTDHLAKAKMFWVEPCDEALPSSSSPPSSTSTPPPANPCPTDLEAVAEGSGTVTLTWTPAPGSDGTNIYRAVDDGAFDYLATSGPEGGAYVDDAVEVDVTYRYYLTALFGDEESVDCDEVEVTVIPDLPTLFAVSAASVGGLAAYLGFRRRKA